MRNIKRYRLVDPTPVNCKQSILTLNQLKGSLPYPLSELHLNEIHSCPTDVPVYLGLVEIWLCLFDKQNATSEMRSVMDGYVTLNSRGDTLHDEEDLEEERALDNDDDIMFEDRQTNQKLKSNKKAIEESKTNFRDRGIIPR